MKIYLTKIDIDEQIIETCNHIHRCLSENDFSECEGIF